MPTFLFYVTTFFASLATPIDFSLHYCYNISTVSKQHNGRNFVGKIIVFANQKGGVGKTTSAVNVAAAMGAKGRRVLLVDLDPQGNTSSGVGINKKNMKLSSYDVLIGRSSAEACIVETDYPNLSVMPSNISLAGAEFELVAIDKREYRLKKPNKCFIAVKSKTVKRLLLCYIILLENKKFS